MIQISLIHKSKNHFKAFLGNHLLLIAFIFLFIYKLSLIGTGASSLPDENRYWHAFHGYFELFHGHWRSACNYFFTLGGRPILALVHLPQFLIQACLYFLFDMDPRSVQSLYYVQLINITYNLILTYYFYLLLIKWTHCSTRIALLACILFGFLTDSNLYLRHLFPYDITLTLWFILFLNIDLVKNNIFIGALVVLITLAYPAYWPMALLAFFLRFFYLYHSNPSLLFNGILNLTLGGILTFGILFLLAFYSGNSLVLDVANAGFAYVNDIKLFYDGSLSIYYRYLIRMDSIVGMMIITLTLIGFILLIHKNLCKIQITPMEIIVITLFVSFSIISLFGIYLDQKLMYGRMLKQFTPLLIMISVYALQYIASQTSFSISLFAFVFIVIIFQSTKFWYDFKKVVYPRDVLSEFVKTGSTPCDFNNYNLVDNKSVDSLRRLDEFEAQLYYSVPPQSLGNKSSLKNLIFVNFELPVVINSKLIHEIHPENSKLIFSSPHFYTFYPYSFDRITFADSKFQNLNLQIKIYQKLVE